MSVAAAMLLAAWCIGCASELRWLWSGLARPTHLVQRAVFLGLMGWGGYNLLRPLALMVLPQDRHDRDVARRGLEPSPRFGVEMRSGLDLRLAKIAVAAALMATLRAFTSIHFVQAAGALVFLYALSSVVVPQAVGRSRWILLLAVLACLPIQPLVDAHLGLPLRLWTAHAVTPVLHRLGVGHVTVESVIVTEGAIADVSNACSGVRTLWYAGALWLGSRLLWPRLAVWRWLLLGVFSSVTAVGFNALRVAALVFALHHRASAPATQLAHASLGLLGLAAVGALLVFGSSNAALGAPRASEPSEPSEPSKAGGSPQPPSTVSMRSDHPVTRPMSVVVVVVATFMVAAVGLVRAPGRVLVEASSLHRLVWPQDLHARPFPLSAEERDLVLGHEATVAEKQHFEFAGVHGTILVVESTNFRAHHAPELCLLAQGAHVDGLAYQSTDDGTYRIVTLQGGEQTAMTWFQSGTRTVPDLGARLWSQLWRPRERWSLVTLVLDGHVERNLPALHRAVHAVVASSYREHP